MDQERQEIDVLIFGAVAKTSTSKPFIELRVHKLDEANQQIFGQEVEFVRTSRNLKRSV